MTTSEESEDGTKNVLAQQEEDPSMINIVDVDDVIATSKTRSTRTEETPAPPKVGNATGQHEADHVLMVMVKSTAPGELKPGAVPVQHKDLKAEDELKEAVEQSANSRAAAAAKCSKKRANWRHTVESRQEFVQHPKTNPPIEATSPSTKRRRVERYEEKGLGGSCEKDRQVQAPSETPGRRFGISAGGLNAAETFTSHLHRHNKRSAITSDANGEMSALGTGTNVDVEPSIVVPPGGYEPTHIFSLDSMDTRLAVASPAEDLVEAEMVDVGVEAEMVDVGRERNIQQERRKRERSQKCCLVGMILLGSVLLAGLVLLILFLVAGGTKNITETSPPGGPPSDASTAAPTSYMIDLPDYTMLALQDPGSPQSKAYSWLHQDPNWETYNQQTLLERFALATVYFSTGGENWKQNNNWLSYDVETCAWFFTTTDDGAWTYPCRYSVKGQPYVNLWLIRNVSFKSSLPEQSCHGVLLFISFICFILFRTLKEHYHQRLL